jgi:hypothetical protein
MVVGVIREIREGIAELGRRAKVVVEYRGLRMPAGLEAQRSTDDGSSRIFSGCPDPSLRVRGADPKTAAGCSKNSCWVLDPGRMTIGDLGHKIGKSAPIMAVADLGDGNSSEVRTFSAFPSSTSYHPPRCVVKADPAAI